ncbi:hypothetical protein, partial [Massilia glaciei]|uniref:hypothetical protein n=1 Tax=Massilia glaciei TaxID=1524097 RepID=UPI001C6333C7
YGRSKSLFIAVRSTEILRVCEVWSNSERGMGVKRGMGLDQLDLVMNWSAVTATALRNGYWHLGRAILN